MHKPLDADWRPVDCQAKDLLRRCSKDPKTHKNRVKCTPIEAYIVSGCIVDMNAALVLSALLCHAPVQRQRLSARVHLQHHDIDAQHWSLKKLCGG